MSARRWWALAAVGLFVTEVLIATVWKRVPFVRADLGDYLVVILLYAMAKAVRPFRALPLAAAIFVFGVAVECAQGLGLADVLGLAPGSVARIVLGTTFQISDLFMYLAGCLTAYLLDRAGRGVTPLPRGGEGDSALLAAAQQHGHADEQQRPR